MPPPPSLPGDRTENKGWEEVKGRGWGRRGLHKVTPCNGWVMALNRGHNSTRRPPEREREKKKERNLEREREKKRAKFPAEGGAAEGGSAVGDPGEGGFWGSCREVETKPPLV